MKFDKIYLTGFMTSGKSTLGPILANVLGWNFFDLDDEIVKDKGKSVDLIFEENGEKYFRGLESQKLEELSILSGCVISLGGGTIVSEENLTLIKNTGKIIYLKSSPEIVYKRIKNKLNRPLFKDLVLQNRPQNEFINRIQELMEKREIYYNQADITINTDSHNIGSTIDYIAHKIIKLLNEEN